MKCPSNESHRVFHLSQRGSRFLAFAAGLCLCLTGCTSLDQYVHNGFKVGPNYCPPPVVVAERWIDEADKRLQKDEIPCLWWKLFGDPLLNDLVRQAYCQNLTLKQMALLVEQARYQLAIDVGNLFPQEQYAYGSFSRVENQGGFFNVTNLALNLNWQLDFWGKFRRTIAADEANLDAAIFNYDVAILGVVAGRTSVGGNPAASLTGVANNYVAIRTNQERIEFLRANVELQRGVLQFVERRFKAGFRVNELDVDQARANLAQIEASIPAREIDMRQANDQLCVLLGIPTVDLVQQWPKASIPTPPGEIAVGLPADLLRRRPDVRRAERQAAAQAELIGIAEAYLYPAFSINGTLGWQATNPGSSGTTGSVGPSFQWNLLNYGRIVNRVRYEDAAFRQAVLVYQNTVLQADQQVEDGLVAFIRQHERVSQLTEAADAAQKAVKIVIAQFEKGAVDFNRYAVIAQNLVTQQDALAVARGDMANSLIQVYQALGGGWEIRCQPEGEMAVETTAPAPEDPETPAGTPKAKPQAPEQVPAPKPAYPEPRRVSQTHGDEQVVENTADQDK